MHKETVNLGFTDRIVAPGAHICLFFTSLEQRFDGMSKYLLSGQLAGERTVARADSVDEEALRCLLADNGISYNQRCGCGAISLLSARDYYLGKGVFDPEQLTANLRTIYEESLSAGYPGCRVIGEMPPEICRMDGGHRLVEYEALVSLQAETHPVTAVCQYDITRFDGEMLMDVLKVHPEMMVNGALVHNPFYTRPEEYLKR